MIGFLTRFGPQLRALLALILLTYGGWLLCAPGLSGASRIVGGVIVGLELLVITSLLVRRGHQAATQQIDPTG